ncbi:MAG: response regulator, partial [Gemmatimonadetes bacterium]|nr:response regulator [Gemmatimonadota bacterium]
MTEEASQFHILIVDDTLQNIQVLGTILREQGYQLNVAQDGVQALKQVAKLIPDLILLDIMMPKMDGFETCKRLKDHPQTRDIPIIFLTAKVETDDLIKGFELGAVDYITKPFQSAELLKRVQTHLELALLRRDLEQRVAERTEELNQANIHLREEQEERLERERQ